MNLHVSTQGPIPMNVDTQGNIPVRSNQALQPMPAIQIGTVETLPEGAEATASFSGDPRTPALNLGIPVGATGSRGADGSDGESAGFGTPTVTVTDLEHGDPATVSITASGPDTAKVFAFSFGIPAGPKGDPGDPATGAVTSVNGKTGTVVLSASDVGAQEVIYIEVESDHTLHPVTGIREFTVDGIHGFFLDADNLHWFLPDGQGMNTVMSALQAAISAKQDTISDLDTIRTGAGLGATAVQTETDPTVPAWAKEPSKPTYTASEVGALPASTTIPSKTSDLQNDSGFLTLQTLPIYSGGVS